MNHSSQKKILEKAYFAFHHPSFINDDPLCIPHRFKSRQDIEIMGLFAALFAWGQRPTIINKCTELITRMNGQPYQFIMEYSENNLKQLAGFKHRTFNDTDLLYMVDFLHYWYSKHASLENAFSDGIKVKDPTVENGLNHFRNTVFNRSYVPARTRKHIASPAMHSACKRINMYLRWMVRIDDKGIDFGIWRRIKPSQLICPLDVHVERTARYLGLLRRKQSDWQAALELTENLRKFDANDPVRYDFALFGLSNSKLQNNLTRE